MQRSSLGIDSFVREQVQRRCGGVDKRIFERDLGLVLKCNWRSRIRYYCFQLSEVLQEHHFVAGNETILCGQLGTINLETNHAQPQYQSKRTGYVQWWLRNVLWLLLQKQRHSNEKISIPWLAQSHLQKFPQLWILRHRKNQGIHFQNVQRFHQLKVQPLELRHWRLNQIF
jgi:hypothetical protein